MEIDPKTTLSSPAARSARSRPTMRDVAALAGVSIKTVSRVVNAEAGVSPPLARRVERAARQLDYHHNLTASSLRRADRKSGIVGLLLEDVANPFSSGVHRAIGDAATRRGVAVLAMSLDEDPVREREFVRAMLLRRVDGLVIMPSGADHGYLRNEMEAGLAVVFIDRPPGFLDADTVRATDRQGSREAVEHLIAHGHRRIAFLGDLHSIATARDRYRGYQDALLGAGLAVDERLVRMDLHGRAAAEEAAGELLELPDGVAPTACFASQNLVAIGTLRALCARDRTRDVAMLAFDDIELGDLLEPGITVVQSDPFALGRAAAELLFERLDGYRGPSRHRLVTTVLVPRGSGEISPPADDGGRLAGSGARRRQAAGEVGELEPSKAASSVG